jgi:hypothetical protein
LGDKTDLGFIEVPEQSYREVAYVPVQPILNQFVYPSDIIAGFDELIYVVDKGTQEVIALDESGKELARRYVQGAKAIAQDRKLDLLVLGTKNDTAGTLINERSCIYRLNLSKGLIYGLQYAIVTNEIVHPFYFKTSSITTDLDVSFNRISVFFDNSYVVTRSGPRNNPTQANGVDDVILEFTSNDNYISSIPVTTNSGQFVNNYFKAPFAITTLAKTPQISVDQRKDFIYTSLDPDGILRTQYIINNSSIDGSEFVPKIDWSSDLTQASSFITDPYKFTEPSGIEYAGDGGNFIFVVDKAKDSLFQFTANGLEGVQPPPASGETKYIKTSFGGTGQGPSNFNEPMAVAYKDEVIYVADAGNGRILRFKLTLDIR